MANVFGQLESIEDVEPLKSYDEWQDEGRQVMMGEKAVSWRKQLPRDVALFHIDQTESIDEQFDRAISREINGWGKPW